MDKLRSLTSALGETSLTLAAYNSLKTKPSDESVCQGFSLLLYPLTTLKKSVQWKNVSVPDISER